MAATEVIRDLLIRFGLVVRPGTKQGLRDLDRQIESTKTLMEDLSRTALRAGVGLAAGLVAGAAALGKLTVGASQSATEIDRQAAALNLSRKEYQEYLHVTQTLGGNASDLADTFLQINEASVRAQEGSREMGDTFKLIGVRVDELKGLNAGQLFELMADRISKTADKQKAMAATSRLLGEESARRFGPAMMKGAAGVRALRQEAEELGVVMGDDQIRALSAVGTQWRRLSTITRGLRNELAAALAPSVERVLRGVTEWIRANRELLSQRITYWVEVVRSSIVSLDAAVRLLGGWDVVFLNIAQGAGLLLLIANFGKLVELVTSARMAFNLLKGAAAAAGLTMSVGFLPVTLIVGTLIGMLLILYNIAEDIYTHFQGGDSLFGRGLDRLSYYVPIVGDLRKLFWELGQTVLSGASNMWLLASAIGRGLSPVLSLVSSVLSQLIGKLTDFFEAWRKFNEWAGSPIRSATEWLQGANYVADNNARPLAAQLQMRTADLVQAQIDSIGRGPASNTSSLSTVNQTNYITADSDLDFASQFESMFRKGGVAVTGGVQ